jgi:hypothetical protein
MLVLASPDTMEGKLKAAVMQLDAVVGGSVGALGTVVGSMGMGGVGKTCALKAVAVDDKMREKFTGGVYFLSLG